MLFRLKDVREIQQLHATYGLLWIPTEHINNSNDVWKKNDYRLSIGLYLINIANFVKCAKISWFCWGEKVYLLEIHLKYYHESK